VIRIKKIVTYFDGFYSLFFPNLCITCESVISGNEKLICTACRLSLPETGYHLPGINPVEELFAGRLAVEKATSLLFFDRGSRYRKLLHQLKYHGRSEVGMFLGRLIGSRLTESNISPIDVIVPVPLHPSRQRRRGFNQSRIIADGIAEILNKPVHDKVLQRKKYTTTQTRKGRFDRWKNVEGIFHCPDPGMMESKHILLVDDVVTTGSTLEAAGSALSICSNVKISVATAAYATT
jgi:ComF family protein